MNLRPRRAPTELDEKEYAVHAWAMIPTGVLSILRHLNTAGASTISSLCRVAPHHRNTVRDRLEWLQERGLIKGLKPITATHYCIEITDKGRQALLSLATLDRLLKDGA